MRQNWRGCQEFLDVDIKFSSTSNEAVKLYDAALQQICYWYSEPSVGGMQSALQTMLETDPEFVMGHVVSLGAALSTDLTHFQLSAGLRQQMEKLQELASRDCVLPWEKQHVKAIELFGNGSWHEASLEYEKLLLRNPLDMLALRFAHMTYFKMGASNQLRDSLARVVPYWRSSKDPLKTTVLGAYAFGLEEAGDYEAAEKEGKAAVAADPQDTYAMHAVTHVYEMTGQQQPSVKWMSETEAGWKGNDWLAGHNYWHWALVHIEEGNYDAALALFDKEVGPRMRSGMPLDLTDGAQVLQRLRFEGVEVGERWREALDLLQPTAEGHASLYLDSHTVMAALGCEEKKLTDKVIQSMKDLLVREEPSSRYLTQLQGQVAVPLLEAIADFDCGEYSSAVNKLLPIRYELQKMGHSHAQRDVYNLLLIHAAMKSSDPLHKVLARNLLVERRCGRKDSPMIDRLQAQLVLI